jgi:hypothetical protein
MKGQKLPFNDHILRYVPYSKLRRDEDDNVVGVLGTAFQLRDGETYLSVTWVEYFDGPYEERVTQAVRAMRRSALKTGAQSGFAVGNVGEVTKACATRNYSIRIVHEPSKANAAHTAVRRYPAVDDELLELLATDSWAKLIMNADMPDR